MIGEFDHVTIEATRKMVDALSLSLARVGTVCIIATHQCWARTKGVMKSLQKFDRPLRTSWCSNLHTNLTRDSSGCDQTVQRTASSHCRELADKSSEKSPTTTPASAETANYRLIMWDMFCIP